MNYKFLIALLIMSYVNTKISYAQTSQSVSTQFTLPSISMLSLSDNSSISLTFQSPSLAGNALGSSTTNTKWLNFSSAVPPSITRKISAQITSGSIPSGVRLVIQTSAAVGGAGTLGSPITTVYPDATSQILINGIGGAYTGVGTGFGYKLTYSLDIQNYSQLIGSISSSSVTITYTIADN